MEIVWILVLTLLFMAYEVQFFTKHCFKNLDFKFILDKSEVFENDNLILNERLSNRTLLPAVWLEVQFLASTNLKFDDVQDIGLDNAFYKRDIYSISAYQKIEKSFNVKALKRGHYSLGDLTLTVTDIFKLYKYVLYLDDKKALYVYPKLLLGPDFDLKFHNIIGDLETKKYLLEDPFMLKGIRDYNPYDSMKTINWSASAKTGDLKVNEYSSSCSMEVIVLLDTTKYTVWDSELNLEESIRLAASMATKCIDKNISVSLYSNGINELSKNYISIPCQTGEAGLKTIYRNLACINLKNQEFGFLDMLKDLKPNENTTHLYIVISHNYSDDLVNRLLTLEKFNSDVNLILVGESDLHKNISSKIKAYVWEVASNELN